MIEQLIDFAEHEFSLSKPNADGHTVREHLEQVERQTGQKIKKPDLPSSLTHVWSAFVYLNSGRTSGEPLTFPDIKAWTELTKTPLEPWAVEIIKRIDNVYMRVIYG